MTLTDPVRSESHLEDAIAIDGVRAERVCRPADAEEMAGLLRQASDDDVSVYPIGSGLHRRFGRTPDRVELALSTEGLTGIVRYDPEDLVVSVQAGTPLAELQAELATNGQWLPVEAPGGSRATIGGMLALGLTGPRQLGSLSLRDLLLGMSVALTDGTVARSGGMVVKNVTGFDMGRLHVGANGTLGVITSANFKVLPRPETEATVIATFGPDAAGLTGALEGFGRLRSSPLRAVAADIVVEPAMVSLAIRFEGRAAAVRRQALSVSELVGGDRHRIDDPQDSRRWWERHVERLGFGSNETTMLRLDARPREIGAAVGTIVTLLPSAPAADWRITVSPGLGRAQVEVGHSSPLSLVEFLASAGAFGGSLTVLGAPPELKATLPGQGATDPRPIDRALRDEFDPRRILNRGRFPIPFDRLD